MVALNVRQARDAEDTASFGCELDNGEEPPEGIICAALGEDETVRVARR